MRTKCLLIAYRHILICFGCAKPVNAPNFTPAKDIRINRCFSKILLKIHHNGYIQYRVEDHY